MKTVGLFWIIVGIISYRSNADVSLIYVRKPKKHCKICISNFRSGWLRGFEIPVLVVFGSSLAGSINDNVISRCISNLIMVFKEEHVRNLRDSHFYMKKEISGKYFETFSLFTEFKSSTEWKSNQFNFWLKHVNLKFCLWAF